MRRARVWIALLGTACGAAGAARADACAENPTAGPCFTVHGRMTFGNGNPGVRIWVIGTSRMLGVCPDDPAPISPACLAEQIGDGKRLYADFRVCPLHLDRPGSMGPVCMQSASHQVVEDANGDVRVVAGVCAGP